MWSSKKVLVGVEKKSKISVYWDRCNFFAYDQAGMLGLFFRILTTLEKITACNIVAL